MKTEQPPRALLVDLSTRFGGASARVLGLLEGMPEGQAALAAFEGSPVMRESRQAGHEVHPILAGKSDPRCAGQIAHLVRRQGFDLIDVQNPQSKLWGSLAARRTGAVLVSTLNSWYIAEHGGRLKGRFYQQIERATDRQTQLYIAVSTEIEAKLRAEGVAPTRIALIQNAITLDGEKLDGSRSWLRGQFNLPDDAIVCCAVGRLVEAKGYAHLINSLSQIAGSHSRLHVLIVGDGHLRDSLESQITRLGLTGRVILAGLQPRRETLRLVKASDLVVMPSISEGTPLALLESAALGKPIVASRAGGIPTILSDGQEALLVDPGNEKGLADALALLASSPSLAARLGDMARKRVERDFSLAAQVEATLEAYRRAEALRGNR
jgi:glycosyltransferase involved in cell wall biosynthesis